MRSEATAQGTRTCSTAVELAVEELSDDATGPAYAHLCPAPALVVIAVAPPGAPPLKIEARLGDGGFVQAGAVALSPVINAEWGDAPMPWQMALNSIEGRIRERGGDLVRALSGAPSATPPGFLSESDPVPPPPIQAPVLPLAVVLLFAVGGTLAARGRRWHQHVLLLAVLALAALVLRLLLGIWGPIHPNGQGPMWMLGAWGMPELLQAYGPGYPALFTWVARHSEAPDTAIFVTNAFLGALAAPVAAVLALSLGFGRGRAWLIGCLVACEPFLVALGTSESYFPSILLGLLLGAVGLVTADREDLPRSARALVGVAGCLALAQAARTHPLAWPLIAVVPAVLLAESRSWRRALLGLGASALATALVIAGTSWGAIVPVARRLIEGLETGPLAGGSLTGLGPGFWAALALWGMAAWASSNQRSHVIAAALPMVAAYVTTYRVFQESQVWAGSYRSTALALAAVVLVGAMPDVRGRWVGPLLGLLLLLSGLGTAARQTTEQMEYRWLRPHLRGLQEGARIAYVGRAGRRVMTLPEQLVPGWSCGTTSGLRVTRPEMLVAGLGPGESRYYIRSSLCSSHVARDLCAFVEGGAVLTQVATTDFPAIATMTSLPFDTDRVPVTLYRVERARTP